MPHRELKILQIVKKTGFKIIKYDRVWNKKKLSTTYQMPNFFAALFAYFKRTASYRSPKAALSAFTVCFCF